MKTLLVAACLIQLSQYYSVCVCVGNTNLLIWISHSEGGTESSQPGICLNRSNRRWLTFVNTYKLETEEEIEAPHKSSTFA